MRHDHGGTESYIRDLNHGFHGWHGWKRKEEIRRQKAEISDP
jgi:hypothetical protein